MHATARDAALDGELVDAFRRETADGHEVAVFIWGALFADGTDTRGAELVAPKPVGRLRVSAVDAFWALGNAELHELRELPRELRRRERARRLRGSSSLRA